MAIKSTNQKAWFFVIPVIVLVAFNALIPLMTVVNYSVQETFGNNVFFFEGVRWFEQVLHSERFHNSLLRQLTFTGIILAIEIPLGVAIALAVVAGALVPRALLRRSVLHHLYSPACFWCGYSLRGLPRHGADVLCPECGRHSPVRLKDQVPPSARAI